MSYNPNLLYLKGVLTMPRKVLQRAIAATALVTASSSIFAAAMPQPMVQDSGLPKTSAFLGYTFTHQNYKDSWDNNYRSLTGVSPVNNYSGITLGMTQMLNDWFALNILYSHYFRKGSNGNDGRLSGLTVGGMGFKQMTPDMHAVGTVSATVGVFSHNGDGGIASFDPSFTDSDVSFVVGAGVQYKVSDNFSIRPMFNLTPFHDRSDTSVSYGFAVSIVTNLDNV